MTDFECHITVPLPYADKATQLAREERWKTSAIHRDPVLGDDTHFYLTKHHVDFLTIHGDMRLMEQFLRAASVPVLRCKIEAVLLDERHV